MREIKFRAVYKPDPAQVMFYQQIIDGNLYFIATDDPVMSYFYEIVMVDDDWLKEQYTGLKDKNGKEIYEGDIIEVLDGNGKDYLTDTGKGSILFLENHGLWYIDGDVNNSLFDINLEYYIEVIGNIHENPELLEKR
jgi:uncharacterized phage protein (TIGR01671 family)